jgi:hypothetical protein
MSHRRNALTDRARHRLSHHLSFHPDVTVCQQVLRSNIERLVGHDRLQPPILFFELAQALALARREGHARQTAVVLMFLARLHQWVCDQPSVMKHAEEVLVLADALGAAFFENWRNIRARNIGTRIRLPESTTDDDMLDSHARRFVSNG